MGDDQDGAGAGQAVNGLLNLRLGFVVHGGGRFIQHQNGRIAQDCPRDGNALLLAAGKADAALPYHRIIALRHGPDKPVGISRLSGFFHFFPGSRRHAVGNVFRNGAVKEEGVLKDHGNLIAQRMEGKAPDVPAVQLHGTGNRVVKPLQQGKNRRFAHAGGPDDGHRLAGARRKGDVLQHRLLRVVMEGHMVKGNLPPAAFQLFCVRGFLDVRLGVQHLKHPDRPGIGRLDVLHQPCQHRQRLVKKAQIHDKSHHIGNRHIPPQRHPAAQADYNHRPQRGEKFHAGMVKGGGEIGPDVHAGIELAFLHHFVVLRLLLREGLDFLHAGKIVLQNAV